MGSHTMIVAWDAGTGIGLRLWESRFKGDGSFAALCVA